MTVNCCSSQARFHRTVSHRILPDPKEWRLSDQYSRFCYCLQLQCGKPVVSTKLAAPAHVEHSFISHYPVRVWTTELCVWSCRLCTYNNVKKIFKRNLAHVIEMAQCMNALAGKVRKQEVPCTQ